MKFFLNKISSKLISLLNNFSLNNNSGDNGDGDGDSGSDGENNGSGSIGKAVMGDRGTGFVTKEQETATHVKDLETIIYDELQKDPEAMAALKKLTNGQIKGAEINEQFAKVRYSDVALEAIANSEIAPPDVKAKAREELRKKQEIREKLQPTGMTPPKPGRPRI